MTWADFYLVCFAVGFLLNALAFLSGGGHLHLHVPHVHLPHGMHLPHGAQTGGARAGQLPWFNFGTLAAFLAWFGGVGYLLERYSRPWFITALALSTVTGLAAAAVVFWFLAKVLFAHEAPLDAADYDMIGVLGRLSIPIREGGTGELIYSQEGTRRVSGARSEDGIAIPKGAEVMVTRYEKGIAYVKPWVDP
ncbi:MAG TPA: hypothetical protein VKV17_18205 [Bryobacteraceae bacterium]|nr:hypothetical protein [Bryobacteraceae bacterium]